MLRDGIACGDDAFEQRHTVMGVEPQSPIADLANGGGLLFSPDPQERVKRKERQPASAGPEISTAAVKHGCIQLQYFL